MAQTAIKQHEKDGAEASGCPSHGTFCWNELMTRDVKRAQKFYEETIGWTFSPMPMADAAPIGAPC
jgi:predicted enzyme related to lactoylglutathione lyase